MTEIRSHNKDRLRRADSWFAQSEHVESEDEKFIFLWIAFNAAYGFELGPEDTRGETKHRGETEKFEKFLEEILRRDHDKKIENVLFRKKFFANQIRKLIQNEFVYDQYWQSVRGEQDEESWKSQFDKHNKRVFESYDNRDTHSVLREVLRRLYTLRNQIFHGGTTCAEGLGRDQLEDGREIMAAIVPVILEIVRADIEANPASDAWGPVAYPRHKHPRRL